jgi:hypothetical protein
MTVWIGKGIDQMSSLRFIVLAMMLIMLDGCAWMTKPMSLDMTPPPGPPEYQQGFLDGCETAIGAYANPFYKTFHTAKQDAELAQNKVYYQIWKDAYAYCAVYIMAQKTHGYGNRAYVY